MRSERLIAERVVQWLDQEFALHLDLRPVMWEREPLLASHHFQDLITPPHDTDIVVVILWSRLGTPLPRDRFAGPLSGGEVSGTEWEFEDALKSYRERGAPEILMYPKTAVSTVDLNDTNAAGERTDRNPYRGLRSFELVDTAFFFGRSRGRANKRSGSTRSSRSGSPSPMAATRAGGPGPLPTRLSSRKCWRTICARWPRGGWTALRTATAGSIISSKRCRARHICAMSTTLRC